MVVLLRNALLSVPGWVPDPCVGCGSAVILLRSGRRLQGASEVVGLPGPTSERRLNYPPLSHSLSGFHKYLTCREGQALSESMHRSLHAAVPTSEKQNVNIPIEEAKDHLTLFHLTMSPSSFIFILVALCGIQKPS